MEKGNTCAYDYYANVHLAKASEGQALVSISLAIVISDEEKNKFESHVIFDYK